MQLLELSDSRKIILFPLLLVIGITVCGFLLIELYFARHDYTRVEQDLTLLARSGTEMLVYLDDDAGVVQFDQFADTYAENSRFRVTIVDESGAVIGDSRLSLNELNVIENHSERPEVRIAREQGIGISRRYSSTLNIDLLYVAMRFHTGKHSGYFRIALPLSDLQQDALSRRMILAAFALAGLLAAITISLMSSRYLLSMIKTARHSLKRRLERRTEQIKLLQSLGTQLTACNTREEAKEVLSLVASLLLPRFNGSLALYRASRDRLEIGADWNGNWLDDTSYTPDQCWALRTGKPHVGNPATGNMKCNHSHIQEQQMLCIPLMAQGETHGVLHLASPPETIWTDEENQLAAAIAEQVSLTFASLDLRESLRQQAIKDALTGLYNRRYLLETIERELSRASRKKQSLGLLMLDLDHFKKFNDNHGHEAGDFILSEFGRLLRLFKRKEDIACRYGGEEFTILLPEADRERTMRVADRICSKIREHNFILNGRSFGPITLSAGAAGFPDNGEDIDTLFKKADEALYRAKNLGRDRAVHASDNKLKNEQ